LTQPQCQTPFTADLFDISLFDDQIRRAAAIDPLRERPSVRASQGGTENIVPARGPPSISLPKPLDERREGFVSEIASQRWKIIATLL
jgi:hypothetical protein